MSHAHLQLIRLSSLICLDVLGQSDPAGRHPAPVTWLMSKDLAERTGRTDGCDGFSHVASDTAKEKAAGGTNLPLHLEFRNLLEFCFAMLASYFWSVDELTLDLAALPASEVNHVVLGNLSSLGQVRLH